jgi:CRP/FNR family transcriptional regulator, nitrogen fixation regulation protein
MSMPTTSRIASGARAGSRWPPPAPAADASIGPFEMMGASMAFARNGEIYGEGEAADHVYKVVSGAVRTSKLLAGGRRQIGGFYLLGDVFGLEVGEAHAFSAEAITESKVLAVKRSTLMALAARESDVSRDLWTVVGRELARVQGHVLLLVRSAQERVAGFLLEMAARRPGADAIELPMSRQDIADYLGLTIETVSRTLTILENDAAISLPNSRRIVLRNRPALRELNA